VGNTLLERMGFGDKYEWTSQHHRDVDPLKAAQADYLRIGKVQTSNEQREVLGLDPMPEPEADQLGSWTPNGFIPIDEPVSPDPVQPSASVAKPNGKAPAKSKPNGAAHT
jgi:hypothetical protein